MKHDPRLIRVPRRCGITPLHYVAGKEGDQELHLLADFLCICKSSIEDLTSRCETAVHSAVKNHNFKAFKVLFGWLRRVYLTQILHWKDEDGNTVLYIAVAKKQPETHTGLHENPSKIWKLKFLTLNDIELRSKKIDGIELLIGYVKIDEKKFQGKTALDIFQENPSGDEDLGKRLRCRGRIVRLLPPNLSLSEFLSMELTVFEKITSWFGLQNESARTIILLSATLITTATYQAALTPPGGYWQENSCNPPANSTANIAVEKPHQAGNIILDSSKLYQFTALNSMVFMASIVTIWITAIPLLPHTLPVYMLMLILSGAFFATATIEFPKPDEVTGIIITVINIYLMLVGLVLPMYLWVNYNRFLRGIDAAKRRVANFLVLKDRK
ncbi:hypothetical protein BT93_D0794 [Corymbia citriodora subsp. variegata]|nr:hypothetical protein BT93_D0794 [Corymbia citriodora subsp. variegata]